MKQDLEHLNHYLADSGKVIIKKDRTDEDKSTKSIWLGNFDNIENYEEIDEVPEEVYIEPIEENIDNDNIKENI